MAARKSTVEDGGKEHGSFFSRMFRSATDVLRRRSHEPEPTSEANTTRAVSEPPRATGQTQAAAPARRRPIQSDVHAIDEMTPSQKSARGPFDERHRTEVGGEEFLANRNSDFNDEDHYTNKSKDPRIGTHGRKYQP
jgi:hypothetical protein